MWGGSYLFPPALQLPSVLGFLATLHAKRYEYIWLISRFAGLHYFHVSPDFRLLLLLPPCPPPPNYLHSQPGTLELSLLSARNGGETNQTNYVMSPTTPNRPFFLSSHHNACIHICIYNHHHNDDDTRGMWVRRSTFPAIHDSNSDSGKSAMDTG